MEERQTIIRICYICKEPRPFLACEAWTPEHCCLVCEAGAELADRIHKCLAAGIPWPY